VANARGSRSDAASSSPSLPVPESKLSTPTLALGDSSALPPASSKVAPSAE
jgi:hypothetical protein